MKKTSNFKRFLSLLLCAVFVLGFVPVGASAQDTAASCQVTITMTDQYGDGWNGAAIAVYEDGQWLCNATVDNGSENTLTFVMDPQLRYVFRWVKGSYDSECGFTIALGDEVVCSGNYGDCAAYANDRFLWSNCEHQYVLSSTVDPTCTQDGRNIYTCTLCPEGAYEEPIPATGHAYEVYYVADPDCTGYGYTCSKCSNCGDTEYDDYVPQWGHTLGADGNCSTCGDVYTAQLTVAEVEVTGENYQDILGDGTASFDPDTHTLTLRNFVYEGLDFAVISYLPVNIVLEGSNRITSTESECFYFYVVDGTVRIGGTGTLQASSDCFLINLYSHAGASLILGGSVDISFSAENGGGIYIGSGNSDLVLCDSVKLTVGSEDSPVFSTGISNYEGSVTITDKAQVAAYGARGYGIYAGNVTVSGGTVTAGGSYYGIYTPESLAITGGTVYARGSYYGIYAPESLAITVSGGTLYAEGGNDGIYTGTLTVSGGTVTASGGDWGIHTLENLTITGGVVEVLRGGLFAALTDAHGDYLPNGGMTLGENVQILEPQGADIIRSLVSGNYVYAGVVDSEGNPLDAFVISCRHRWEQGKCALCGVPFTIEGKGFTLSFENEILVNFYYEFSDGSGASECGMLVYLERPEKVDFDTADQYYSAYYIPETGQRMCQTEGIAAKEMGDERYYVAYVKLADGSYCYSDIYSYSPANYAYRKLADENAKPELKALCVAMLNYGAAAQQFFGYRTERLMNADLTQEQQALVAGFDWDLLNGAAASDKETTFRKTEGFDTLGASVSFDGALAINYYFKPSVRPLDVTFYYWTAEDYAKADALTADTATGSWLTQWQGNGVFWAQVDDIAAKELDDTVYVAATYEYNGETCCTGIIAYSVSTYCRNQAEGTMAPLPTATAAYGYYASEYFAS